MHITVAYYPAAAPSDSVFRALCTTSLSFLLTYFGFICAPRPIHLILTPFWKGGSSDSIGVPGKTGSVGKSNTAGDTGNRNFTVFFDEMLQTTLPNVIITDVDCNASVCYSPLRPVINDYTNQLETAQLSNASFADLCTYVQCCIITQSKRLSLPAILGSWAIVPCAMAQAPSPFDEHRRPFEKNEMFWGHLPPPPGNVVKCFVH